MSGSKFQHGLSTNSTRPASDSVVTGTLTCTTLNATTENVDTIVNTSIQVGASGSAGTLTIYPTTAAKGHLAILAVDSAGNTTTTITNASQAGARTYTIPDAGASTSFVMAAGTQTIAGVKTFSSAPVIGSITNTGLLTLPTSTDTLVGRATTDTLTNKTLTSPTINTAILSIAASRSGTFVANGATPVTVTNANVTANSVIVITLKTVGGTVGAVPAIQTITPTTGFTVAATASDTSTYNFAIIS